LVSIGRAKDLAQKGSDQVRASVRCRQGDGDNKISRGEPQKRQAHWINEETDARDRDKITK
jgi:hypothetical protein